VGDLYAQVTARSYWAFWRLAAGDPEGARKQLEEALGLWTQGGYHLQHFYGLRLASYVDVYEGKPLQGWTRICDAWPAVRRSGLLRHPVVAADACLLRARVALAAASTVPGEKALLGVAAKHSNKLARVGRSDTAAHALVLKAGIAAARGDPRRSVGMLESARQAFLADGLTLSVACADRRLGELAGAAGHDRVMTADAVLASGTIRDPGRWLAIHAPGFVGVS